MHRLREFDVVAIALPDDSARRDAEVRCHVVAIAGSTIALEPVERASVTWLPERVEGAFLAFHHHGSLIALKGVLLQRAVIGDLRFKISDPLPGPARPSSRAQACVPVSLRWDATDTRSEGLTLEVSADELLIECADATTEGAALELTLSLPGSDEPIEAPATIASADGGRVLARLDATTADARRRLATFVLEHNRAALRSRQRVASTVDVDF